VSILANQALKLRGFTPPTSLSGDGRTSGVVVNSYLIPLYLTILIISGMLFCLMPRWWL
jgi:hypothetical protein